MHNTLHVEQREKTTPERFLIVWDHVRFSRKNLAKMHALQLLSLGKYVSSNMQPFCLLDIVAHLRGLKSIV